jgi:hypothetical protein
MKSRRKKGLTGNAAAKGMIPLGVFGPVATLRESVFSASR